MYYLEEGRLKEMEISFRLDFNQIDSHMNNWKFSNYAYKITLGKLIPNAWILNNQNITIRWTKWTFQNKENIWKFNHTVLSHSTMIPVIEYTSFLLWNKL